MNFDNKDVESAVKSLSRRISHNNNNKIDINRYKSHLIESAHLSHKDWTITESYSDKLRHILGGIDDKEFQLLFQRVLNDGNFNIKNSVNSIDIDKSSSSSNSINNKPWVVLVTGVNGIRKTTSLNQPWFQELLYTCIKPPTSNNNDDDSSDIILERLPAGKNSFYRQLDYMVATLAVEEFETLYKNSSSSGSSSGSSGGGSGGGSGGSGGSGSDVEEYSRQKAVIFSKYRMIAEQLGE